MHKLSFYREIQIPFVCVALKRKPMALNMSPIRVGPLVILFLSPRYFSHVNCLIKEICNEACRGINRV